MWDCNTHIYICCNFGPYTKHISTNPLACCNFDMLKQTHTTPTYTLTPVATLSHTCSEKCQTSSHTCKPTVSLFLQACQHLVCTVRMHTHTHTCRYIYIWKDTTLFAFTAEPTLNTPPCCLNPHQAQFHSGIHGNDPSVKMAHRAECLWRTRKVLFSGPWRHPRSEQPIGWWVFHWQRVFLDAGAVVPPKLVVHLARESEKGERVS